MSQLRKVTGAWLLVLCLGVSLVLVSSWTTPSFATGGSVMIDPSTGGESDPSAGDPDGPDDKPLTNGTISGGSLSSGTSTDVQKPSVAISTGTPERRGGVWARWMHALKLALRTAFVVH